jgi:hypothetical protein
MGRHMIDLAPLYAVGITAALLSLLAWIGLFSNLLDVSQLLAIACFLTVTIVLILLATRHLATE